MGKKRKPSTEQSWGPVAKKQKTTNKTIQYENQQLNLNPALKATVINYQLTLAETSLELVIEHKLMQAINSLSTKQSLSLEDIAERFNQNETSIRARIAYESNNQKVILVGWYSIGNIRSLDFSRYFFLEDILTLYNQKSKNSKAIVQVFVNEKENDKSIKELLIKNTINHSKFFAPNCENNSQTTTMEGFQP